MILLKNEGVLPLTPGKRIAIIGPFGNDSSDLAGNYYEWLCPNTETNTSCVPTLLVPTPPLLHLFLCSTS